MKPIPYLRVKRRAGVQRCKEFLLRIYAVYWLGEDKRWKFGRCWPTMIQAEADMAKARAKGFKAVAVQYGKSLPADDPDLRPKRKPPRKPSACSESRRKPLRPPASTCGGA